MMPEFLAQNPIVTAASVFCGELLIGSAPKKHMQGSEAHGCLFRPQALLSLLLKAIPDDELLVPPEDNIHLLIPIL